MGYSVIVLVLVVVPCRALAVSTKRAFMILTGPQLNCPDRAER